MTEFEAVENVQRIGIVGAGPAGLTAAMSLRHVGFDVQIFEQSREFGRVGAGIQLSPNATAVLEPLGVLENLMSVGVLPSISRSFRFDTGDLVQETPIGGRAYRTPYVQVHRADLHQVLATGLPESVFHLDKKVSTVEQDDHLVRLGFADGTSAEVDVLIGADGIHSVVRDQCFPERELSFSGWASHRGILKAEAVADLDIDVINAKWMAPDNRDVIHYYISGQEELTFIAKIPEATASQESWSRESDKDELLARLRGFHPTILELVSRCDKIGKWAIYDREPLYAWSVGRVTLIGDAAHPMRPWIGQGGTAAIEDGAVLARSFSELGPSARLIDAWEVYEWNRKPRVSWMKTLSASHEFRKPFAGSPHPSRYLYSYDAWRDPLVKPRESAKVV